MKSKILILSFLIFTLDAFGEERKFIEPKVGNMRMDACLSWGKGCRETAAHQWCKEQYNGKAIHWEIEENIGNIESTKMLVSREICSSKKCDAFKVIVCKKSI